MNPFLKNDVVWLEGAEMRVVRQVSDDSVQLEHAQTGALCVHPVRELLDRYARGQLLTSSDYRRPTELEQSKNQALPQTHRLSTAAQCLTRMRVDYMMRLQNAFAFELPREELVAMIKSIADERGDECPPHISTVYRWRKQYLLAQRDVRALIANLDRRGGTGKTRLDPLVESIVMDKIDTIFLAQRRSSAEEIYNAVFVEIQRLNTQRIESEWLAVPSLRTIQRRLKELYAFDVAVARYGKREAERRFANQMGARRVSRILELVEIDHSPVDILVTDEHGVVLGRPTITVVLDRMSRCVLGFHLSLAGHGTSAVFAALRHALLPKTYLKDRYADLNLTWDCFGWFEVVLMDNGREFHSEAVANALINLSIGIEYAKSRTPNDKPHVERFLRTFNYSFIHRLPGTTLAKVADREGFKSEEEACIPFSELDRLIHVWICSVYHLRAHAGLGGRSPVSVWRESAQASPPQLKANSEDLDVEFAQAGSCALQHYGVDLNTFVYVSQRLLTLRRMLPQGARVDVKWPAHDAGHIFVWDQIKQEYFKVENKDQQFCGLTVEQAKWAKKLKAEADPTSQTAIATAEALVRGQAKASKSAKALKDRKKGARFDNMTSQSSRAIVNEQYTLPLDAVVRDHSAPTAQVVQPKDVPLVEADWIKELV